MKEILSVRGIHYDRPKRMKKFLMAHIIKPLMKECDFFSCDRPINCSVSKYSNYSQIRKKISDKNEGLFSLIFNQAIDLEVPFRFLEYRNYSKFAGISAERDNLEQQLLTKIKKNELSKYDVLDEITLFLKKNISMIQQRDADIANNFFNSLDLMGDNSCIFYGALHNWDRRVFNEFRNNNHFELYFMMPDYSKHEDGLYINNALISRIILSKSNFEKGLSNLTDTIFLTELLSDVFKQYGDSVQKELFHKLSNKKFIYSDTSRFQGDLILYSEMNEYFGEFFGYMRDNKGKKIIFKEFEDKIQSLSENNLKAVNEIMIEKFYLALDYLQGNRDCISQEDKSKGTKVF